MNLLRKPDTHRAIHRGCVSLYTLYGGRNKNQHRNYIRVPPRTAGTVTFEVTDGEDGSVSLMVKFKTETGLIYVRCAPTMVELNPI